MRKTISGQTRAAVYGDALSEMKRFLSPLLLPYAFPGAYKKGLTRGRKRPIFVMKTKAAKEEPPARQPKPLRHWTNQIKGMFPNLSKPQAEVLAAFSFGIAKAESRPLNAIARGLTFLGIPDPVGTRLRRFISNPRIDMAEYCENLARSVIRALPRKKPVVLLVDETSLQARLKAVVVSVAYAGRAVPAAMMTCHQTRWPMGQVEMIATTLRRVRDEAGKGRDLVAMEDRGIGMSPNPLGDRKSLHALHDARVEDRPGAYGR